MSIWYQWNHSAHGYRTVYIELFIYNSVWASFLLFIIIIIVIVIDIVIVIIIIIIVIIIFFSFISFFI